MVNKKHFRNDIKNIDNTQKLKKQKHWVNKYVRKTPISKPLSFKDWYIQEHGRTKGKQ